MGNNFSGKYSVDIVMCIDATGSMKPLIDKVKKNALNFYRDFTDALEKKEKHVNEVRVRVIAFRDYIADGNDAMLTTDFFRLPDQADQFKAAVSSIEAKGGGDDPEDALEALAFAIKSKWTHNEGKKRHVIVLWTDAGAHPLGYGKSAPNYPAKMPKDFAELSEWWGAGQNPGRIMDDKFKRLLIYAPQETCWTRIADGWNNALLYPSVSSAGSV